MPPYSLRRLSWAGPVATAAAILAGMLYYGVTRALGEQYLMPLKAGGSLPAPMTVSLIVAAILVPGLLATILFGFLIHFARRPGTIFLSVCVAALVLSFGGPFNLPGSGLQTKLLLSGMHGITAVIISGGILFLSRSDLIE
jgi:hypothetical protein